MAIDGAARHPGPDRRVPALPAPRPLPRSGGRLAAAAKTALESGEATRYKAASESLNRSAHRMAEALYQAKASGEPKKDGKEDVVDAEFEDLGEKK